MMTEVGSMSLQMAKKFGLSSKDIGKDIADMKGDFVSFGNMSTAQMAASSAYARKLGMDMKDLKGVVDKFDDFEGAAESVSQLNQAFGMQLDTMKMMNAENPAERIDMMRNAFHAAGKSIETMTRQEKKLLMAQTNLSESALKNAFAAENQGIAYGDFADAAGDAEENQLSQEEVMLKLANAIEKIAEAGQSFSGIGDAFGKGFMRAMSKDKDMRALMKTIRSFLRAVFDFGQAIGRVFMKVIKSTGLLKGLKDLFDPAKFKQFTKGIMEPIKELANWLITGEGDPNVIFGKFSDKIAAFFSSKKGAVSKIGGAFARMGEMMLKLLGALAGWLFTKLAPVFTSIFDKIGKYMSKNWKPIAIFIAKYVFAPMMLYAMAKGLIFAAGGGIMKMAAAGFMKIIMGSAMAAKAGAASAAAIPSTVGITGFLKSIGAIPWAAIGKATVILLALVGVFAVAIVAFSAAVALGAMALSKVSWGDMAKVFVTVGLAIAATGVMIAAGEPMFALAPLMPTAAAGLVAAALLFTVGVAAYALGILVIDKILKKVKLKDFAANLTMVGTAIAATIALGVFGTGAAAIAIFGPIMVIGLIAAGALFEKGVSIFAKAIGKVMPHFKLITANRDAIDYGLASLTKVMDTIFQMKELSYGFGIFSPSIKSLEAGFAMNAKFFMHTTKDIAKMIKSILTIPMKNPKDLESRLFIVGKLVKAMESMAELGFKAAKMAIVAKIFAGAEPIEMMKAMGDFIMKIGTTLGTLISLIVKLASGLKADQLEGVKVIAVVLKAVAALANALFSPLKAVSEMQKGMFGEKVTTVMTAVVAGLGTLMGSIIEYLPKMINALIDIATSPALANPKDLKPKMEVISIALGAVADFASAIGEVAKLIPSGSTAWYKKDKTLAARLREMGTIIQAVVDAVKTHVGGLVRSLTTIDIGGKPEEISAKIKVIAAALGALGSFASVIEKIGAMPAAVGFSKLVGVIVEDFRKAIGPTKGEWDLTDMFEKLVEFSAHADPAKLKHFDTAIKAVDSMAGFAGSVSTMISASGGNAAGLHAGISGVVRAVFTAINELKRLDGLKLDVNLGPIKSLETAMTTIQGTFHKFQPKLFGEDGRVVAAVTSMVESYNLTYAALQTVAGAPVDLDLRMSDFADKMGLKSDTFTVQNEKLNFTINVKVELDAEKLSDALSDKPTMGKKTVMRVAGG